MPGPRGSFVVARALSARWVEAYAKECAQAYRLGDIQEARNLAGSMTQDWLSLPDEEVSQNMYRAALQLGVGLAGPLEENRRLLRDLMLSTQSL